MSADATGAPAAHGEVTVASARLQVDTILASQRFVKAERLGRFPRYVSEKTLEGQEAQVKESTIDLEVFGRPTASYDPSVDPIVRVQARRLRAKRALNALISVGCLTAAGICQAAERVDLQLVLAVDVSSSMSVAEQRVQREGYEAALRDPDVVRAIMSGPLGRIAAIYVEWGDYGLNPVQWSLIDDTVSAEKLAGKLAHLPFRSDVHTSISRALYFSAGLFDRRFVSDRKVIDISGDGPNNLGAPVIEIRDMVVSRGISINGLPITLRDDSTSGNVDINRYYRDCVIGGPGAFVMPVAGTAQMARTIRQKLLREVLVAAAIAGKPPLLTIAKRATAGPIDCGASEGAQH